MTQNPRIVVITGAASGIGFAAAARFRDLGDVVYGLDISPTVPDGVTYLECDVSSRASVDAALAQVAQHGRIDVLANIAGIVQFGHFESVSEEVFDRVQAVNLKGPFMLIQGALPLLKAAKGNVVNVSSVAGNKPQPYSAAYSAAKGGLTMLTKALALEFAPAGVRFNAICPGTVDTPIVAQVAANFPSDLDARASDRLIMMIPGPAIDPDEIAASVVFLASKDARMISGSVLAHDGVM